MFTTIMDSVVDFTNVSKTSIPIIFLLPMLGWVLFRIFNILALKFLCLSGKYLWPLKPIISIKIWTAFLAATGMLYEWLCHRGHMERDRQRQAKSHFGLSFGSGKYNFYQKWVQTINLKLKTSM